MASPTLPLPLPEKSVLLHIGPHKTGTSALQSAFHLEREKHAEHGIHYAGKAFQPYLAARAFTGVAGPPGDPEPTPAHRAALIDEVAKSEAKYVVVSSERFADADDAAARDVVSSLGGDRVYVAVTLRPLTKILPSHWQQGVRQGMRQSYRSWLKAALTDPIEVSSATTFWRRHAHDRLVERWAEAAGADKVIVVMGDDANRRAILDAFESLLGIPAGELAPPQGEIVNRSLTLPEIEVIRRINQQFHQREWTGPLYRSAVRFGAVPAIRDRDPGSEEPAIWTPEWAVDRASELGTAAAKRIAASGVHVIGNLDLLGWRPRPGSVRQPPSDRDLRIPVETAALAVMGAIAGAEHITAKKAAEETSPPQQPTPIVKVRKGVRRRLRRVKRRVAAVTSSSES
jgi:hypothetical protein